MPRPSPYIKNLNDNNNKHHKNNYIMTLVQTNCRPERRALASLTQTQLDDFGVTAQEAETEVNRPVWDVPASWRR